MGGCRGENALWVQSSGDEVEAAQRHVLPITAATLAALAAEFPGSTARLGRAPDGTAVAGSLATGSAGFVASTVQGGRLR